MDTKEISPAPKKVISMGCEGRTGYVMDYIAEHVPCGQTMSSDELSIVQSWLASHLAHGCGVPLQAKWLPVGSYGWKPCEETR
jgi:hypothetical protein